VCVTYFSIHVLPRTHSLPSLSPCSDGLLQQHRLSQKQLEDREEQLASFRARLEQLTSGAATTTSKLMEASNRMSALETQLRQEQETVMTLQGELRTEKQMRDAMATRMESAVAENRYE